MNRFLRLLIGLKPKSTFASGRPIPANLRNATPLIVKHDRRLSAGIFTEPPLLATLLTFGIDRIMFSVDYPYAPNAKGRAFLDRISLSPADMAKLTHGNAEALLKLGR